MTTEERAQLLERLLEVTRNLSAAMDSESFLQSVTSIACELTSSEAASIMEYDEIDGQLRFVAMPWFHGDSLRGVRIPLTDNAAGEAFRLGKPLTIQDIKSDPRHYKSIDKLTGFETRSLLAAPIFLMGGPVGVIEVLNKKDNANYTEEDVYILETLASQTSIVFQNLRLEMRVQSVYDELAELDRMKNDFIAITSHELRTPLGLILGHATFLREVIGEEHHEQLDTIIYSAKRLKEIIESLSSVDNFESGAARLRSRQISLNRVLDEVVDSFQLEANEKQISLRVDTGHKDLVVEGDSGKIVIALSSLIKNAITFTEKGGKIIVVAENIPGYVKVSVVDNGIGIPANDLPRIFERFYQVETHLTRRYGGMGLGLSVAKVMIEMHGGRIWAESTEGKGSNFTFLLPTEAPQVDDSDRPVQS